MSDEIVKSPVILQKEMELKGVEKNIKKINTQIKRNRTMLKNLKRDIIEIQSKVQTGIFGRLEEIEALRKEVVELLKKSKLTDKLFGEEKEALEDFIDGLEEESFINEEQKAKLDQARESRQEDTGERQKSDPFANFFIKPKEKEQRNIRKVYLKLASRFHPDKAKNKREAERFHSLMQEIVAAYEKGDVQKLLDIEEKYAAYESPEEIEDGTGLVDAIQSKIDRLNNQLKLLTAQNQRLKDELKQIRDSDVGNALKAEKRKQRYSSPFGGIFGDFREPSIDEAVEQTIQLHEMFTSLKEGILDFMKTGVISPELEEHLMEIVEPQANPFDIFDDDDDDDDDGFFFFDDDDDDDDDDNISPEEALAQIFGMMEEMIKEAQEEKKAKQTTKKTRRGKRKRK